MKLPVPMWLAIVWSLVVYGIGVVVGVVIS